MWGWWDEVAETWVINRPMRFHTYVFDRVAGSTEGDKSGSTSGGGDDAASRSSGATTTAASPARRTGIASLLPGTGFTYLMPLPEVPVATPATAAGAAMDVEDAPAPTNDQSGAALALPLLPARNVTKATAPNEPSESG